MTASPIAHFLAHAVALETEAGDRYDELADAMAVHNNAEVADLFRQLGDFSRRHAAEVRQYASAHQPLPRLKTWQYRWDGPEAPETGDSSAPHYLMGAYQALSFALANERRGWEYYNHVALDARDADVRTLAGEFAREEAVHVATLERWLDRTPLPADDWADDPDPAQVLD